MLSQSTRAGEFLVSEGNGYISREKVTFAALTEALPAGQIVAQLNSGGNWVKYNPAAESTGAEAAAGVLYGPLDESGSTQQGVVIARMAEVAEADLTGLDSAARDALADLDIIVR